MKTKSVTIPIGTRAITLTLWEDLGCLKVTKSFICFIGWERITNVRVSAMDRVDNTLITIGPLGLSYSKFYIREE